MFALFALSVFSHRFLVTIATSIAVSINGQSMNCNVTSAVFLIIFADNRVMAQSESTEAKPKNENEIEKANQNETKANIC